MVKEMYFKAGLDFIMDTFSTIRRGVFWDVELKSDHYIYCHIGNSHVSEDKITRVAEVYVKRFADLNKDDLLDNFEPNCRDYSGILERMKDLYPGFHEDEIITIVRLETWGEE